MHCRAFQASCKHVVHCSKPALLQPGPCLPFLYHTRTIQRWFSKKTPKAQTLGKFASTKSNQGSIPSRSGKEPSSEFQDELPFEDDGGISKPSESTMTDMEHAAFSRLFKTLVKKHDASVKNDSSPLPEDVMLEQLKKQDFERDEYDDELDSVLDRALDSKSQDIQALPPELRAMATRAHMEITKNKMGQDSRKSDNVSPAEEQRLAAVAEIEKRMVRAETDVELWKVLEEEVFSKIREANKTEQLPAATTPEEGRKSGENSSLNRSIISFYGPQFPGTMTLALGLLTHHTRSSQLAEALIPTLKSLGHSVYHWGITSAFYSNLLWYQWHIHNRYDVLIATLKEVDAAGLTLGNAAERTLQHINTYRTKALEGRFGEGVQALENVPKRTEEARQLKLWEAKIKQGIEQNALERLRRSQAEERAREEGAFVEEDGVKAPVSKRASFGKERRRGRRREQEDKPFPEAIQSEG